MMICRVTLVASLLACLSYCVLASDLVMGSKTAATTAASTTSSAPAVKPLTITLDDKVSTSVGKTFTVIVGQIVEVRLDGIRMRTGWETSRIHGVLESANDEFVPMPEAPDPAMGTYVFRYKAAKEGEATLNFSYITPGGPAIKMRSRSAIVDQFKVIINVKDPAGSASSQPATAPSTRPLHAIYKLL